MHVALLSVCDRCARPDALKPCFGDTVELCGECSRSFESWWTAGKLKPLRQHARPSRYARPKGWAFEAASWLIARFGYATPEGMAERAACTTAQAYNALQYLRRAGLLRGGCVRGFGFRFYLAEPAQAGAAE